MITKGQKINDRYEIIKSIGEGGMANVYLAKDIILDLYVVFKEKPYQHQVYHIQILLKCMM